VDVETMSSHRMAWCWHHGCCCTCCCSVQNCRSGLRSAGSAPRLAWTPACPKCIRQKPT
jgi:hypothetical protein